MCDEKVIGLDLNTKIQYYLHDFFAPISVTTILLCSIKINSTTATLISILSIIIGLMCLFNGISKYNYIIYLTENGFSLCKKTKKSLKIIQTFNNTDNIPPLMNNFTVKTGDKKIKLLYQSPSLIAVAFYAGPLIIIPHLKLFYLSRKLLYAIKNKIPQLVTLDVKEPSKVSVFISNLLMWLFVIFVVFVGSIGIILTPFYSFFE